MNLNFHMSEVFYLIFLNCHINRNCNALVNFTVTISIHVLIEHLIFVDNCYTQFSPVYIYDLFWVSFPANYNKLIPNN